VTPLSGGEVTIGRSLRCSLVVDDSSVPSILARIKQVGDGSVVIECLSGVMCVNAVPLRRLERAMLANKDQISFAGSATYGYVFANFDKPSGEVRVMMMKSAEGQRLTPHEEKTLSDWEGRSSSLRPPPLISSPTSVIASSSSVGASSRGRFSSMFQHFPFPVDSSDGAPAGRKRLRVEEEDLDEAPGDAGGRSAPRQVLVSPEERAKRFDELLCEFNASVVAPQDNAAVPLEEMKYRVLDSTKNILQDVMSVHLLDPAFSQFAASLSSCVILDGPFGTEILQTELVLAIAKHLRSSVLVLDHHSVLFADGEYPAAQESETSPRDQLFGGLMRSKMGPAKASRYEC
jgi:hypothetical protein